MKPQRILIAGSGYVGARLAELLAADRHTVFALRRSPAQEAPGISKLQVDLNDAAGLRRLPDPIDAAVFAAGPSAGDEKAYRRIFVEGLGNLIAALAAQEQPPRRLIFTSSTAVYGQHRGEWVDETSPTRPQHFNGRVLLDAEGLVHASTIPGCVLRLGGIYGPGRSRAITRVRAGDARIHAGPPRYTNRIHRDDAAGALRHLLQLEKTAPVYLGVDRQPADSRELILFLAHALGLPTPPEEETEAATPRRGGSKRCRNDRLLAGGYRFAYPTFREGYAALLRAPANSAALPPPTDPC